MRPLNREIAAIVHLVAEFGEPLRKTGHANRGRTKMHPAFALAVAQRHAENGDLLDRVRRFPIRFTASLNHEFHRLESGCHSKATSDKAVSSFGPGLVPS